MSKSREAYREWMDGDEPDPTSKRSLNAFLAGWTARGSADLGALPTNLANIDQWNDGRSKGVAECRRAIAALDENTPERRAPAPDGTDNPGATE